MQEQIIQTSLQAMCQQILELQKHWDHGNNPEMSQRGALIKTDGPQRHRDMIDANSLPGVALRVECRDGFGSKSKVPWIRIYSEKHSPSAKEG